MVIARRQIHDGELPPAVPLCVGLVADELGHPVRLLLHEQRSLEIDRPDRLDLAVGGARDRALARTDRALARFELAGEKLIEAVVCAVARHTLVEIDAVRLHVKSDDGARNARWKRGVA